MRVLVTGGAGFIGSHLIDALLVRGEEVVCLDDLSTGSEENIQQHRSSPHFQFLRADVAGSWEATPTPDRIFHLASPASPVHYQRDPIRTLRTNVVGTMRVLEFARQCHALVVHASTSEVYGNPQVHPQPESYVGHVNPLGSRACYDEGKRCAETLCADYRRVYGLTVKIARIFNTYGPRMAEDDGRVVSNFIVQALRGDPLTVYGTGDQTRSFQYISDLVRGLLLLSDHPNFCGPVNLGTQEEYAVRDLAGIILRLTGSKSTLTFRDLPEGDPERRRPDTTLARTQLEWEPTVKLEEGLRETIAYFRERLGD